MEEDPAERVLAIELATGIPREQLRPDLYVPAPESRAKKGEALGITRRPAYVGMKPLPDVYAVQRIGDLADRASRRSPARSIERSCMRLMLRWRRRALRQIKAATYYRTGPRPG